VTGLQARLNLLGRMATQQEEQQGAYSWDKTAKMEGHDVEGEQEVRIGLHHVLLACQPVQICSQAI